MIEFEFHTIMMGNTLTLTFPEQAIHATQTLMTENGIKEINVPIKCYNPVLYSLSEFQDSNSPSTLFHIMQNSMSLITSIDDCPIQIKKFDVKSEISQELQKYLIKDLVYYIVAPYLDEEYKEFGAEVKYLYESETERLKKSKAEQEARRIEQTLNKILIEDKKKPRHHKKMYYCH
jgi:hypothetical protein